MQALWINKYALSGSHDSGRATARWALHARTLALVLTIMPRLCATTSANTAISTGATTSAATGAAAAASETVLLEVYVNGHSLGKVGEFNLIRGKLMARRTELLDLGIRVPLALGKPNATAAPPGSDPLISLSDLPGLTWRLDEKTQTVYITTSNDRLIPVQLQLDANEKATGRRVIESGTGITLNYDIVGTFAGGRNGGTGSLDLRAFSPWGVLSSDWLTYAGATSNGAGTNTEIRLDSAYSFADVNSLRRYSLGDFITGGLGWTRPVRLEGVQVRSDFSMRPDLVTFPLPSVRGSAAVPSTVDLLVNGSSVISSPIEAGPFEVPQLPVISGAGTISMTVTNALGQQVTVNQPFYASAMLLAPGLQVFSAQAGLARLNWGSVSNDYGKIAGTALYRRGLTSMVTIEGSAEGTPGAFMAGAGAVMQIGSLGVVNFAGAASTGSGHPGAQFSAGAQRIGRVFSLGASAIIANRNYRDVAAMYGDGIPRKQISAFTSLSLRRIGSVGAAYAGLDQDASPSSVQLNIAPVEHSHILSVNYSRPFHRVSIYVSEFRDLVNTGNGGLQVGVTIPFGKRSSIDVSGTSQGIGQIEVQQPAAMIGQWGYQAYIAAGDTTHVFAQGLYKSPWALLTAGVDSQGETTTLDLETQGALSWVDKGLFPSNTIFDSFAIVDTSPMAHVNVLQENRDVGITGSTGRLLVPDMRSFDLNHIAIVATDIPPDSSVHDNTREVRPQDRSGVVVKFAVRITHGALLRLVDEAGAPVPLGSTATLRATGVTVPVGYDGDAYVEDLSPHNEVTVERMDGRRCAVAFDYRPLPGDIPSIGPLRCMEPKP
jgi:outer membrane usher protein